MKFFEVKADHTTELTSVNQDEELRLHSSVEVHLNQGSLVAVDADVGVVLKGISRSLVVLLDFGDHGVPLCGEVEQRESGSLLVQVGNRFVEALRNLNIMIELYGITM